MQRRRRFTIRFSGRPSSAIIQAVVSAVSVLFVSPGAIKPALGKPLPRTTRMPSTALPASSVNNPDDLAAISRSFFGPRLDYLSQLEIRLNPAVGSVINIADDIVVLDPADIVNSYLTNLGTDNTITALGADSGALPAMDTTYHVYASGPRASPFPSTLRLSLTAPTADAYGAFYLGASGNAALWRHVGWARTTTAAGGFVSDDQNRLVVSRYNRVWKRIQLRPGYQDDNANDVFSVTSAVWVRAVGGAGGASEAAFIANGQDHVHVTLCTTVEATGAGGAKLGIGDNSATAAAVASLWGAATPNVPGACNHCIAPAMEGELRTITVLALSPGAATTWYCDYIRTGAATDPAGTQLNALIPV